jgi:hypothetical protein
MLHYAHIERKGGNRTFDMCITSTARFALGMSFFFIAVLNHEQYRMSLKTCMAVRRQSFGTKCSPARTTHGMIPFQQVVSRDKGFGRLNNNRRFRLMRLFQTMVGKLRKKSAAEPFPARRKVRIATCGNAGLK